MRIYETTFIVNPQTDDSSIDGSVKSVTDIITHNGGKILHEDRMGTRRLAYEIQGLNQGYYTSIVFEGEITILPLLKQHFKLGESYMRDLTVQFEGSLDDRQRRPDRDESDRDYGPDRRERREPRGERPSPQPAPRPEAQPSVQPEAHTTGPSRAEAESESTKPEEVEATASVDEETPEPGSTAPSPEEEEKKPAPEGEAESTDEDKEL